MPPAAMRHSFLLAIWLVFSSISVDFLYSGAPLSPPDSLAYLLFRFGRSSVVLLIIKPSIWWLMASSTMSVSCWSSRSGAILTKIGVFLERSSCCIVARKLSNLLRFWSFLKPGVLGDEIFIVI